VGHEQWFLDDLCTLNGGEPDLRSVFGRHQTTARDATLALMGEVQRTRNDTERLALVLVCEATGEVFFDKVEQHLRDVGRTAGLKFFAGLHPQAERNQELFQKQMELIVTSLTLSEEARAQSFALVDRSFSAFQLLMDGVEEAARRVDNPRPSRPSPESGVPTASAA
jgi:hypothetical protein